MLKKGSPSLALPNRERRFTLDTNLFIHAARDREVEESLVRFHAAFAPFEVLTSVVAQELLAGARGDAVRVVRRSIIEPFERRDRIIVPSHNAWKECGDVLAELVGSRQMRWTDIPRSFVNDVLLAETCRENGIVLLTENTRDFERIAGVRPFDFASPWPQPIA